MQSVGREGPPNGFPKLQRLIAKHTSSVAEG
jgi:hypothetical protein